jgi:hypothetical protein
MDFLHFNPELDFKLLLAVPAIPLFGYVIPFELAAVVLTVALVAAVYIARRRKVDLEEERAA